MFSIFSARELPAAEAARLRRIEHKLDLILNHLGLDFESDSLPEEVRRLADSGRKIDAIKAHRAAFGSGLREAKEAVENYLHRR